MMYWILHAAPQGMARRQGAIRLQQDEVTFRQFVASDAAALQELLRAVWGDDRTALQYYRFGETTLDSAHFLHTVVAEQGRRCVGFGSIWSNAFHPYTCYFGINVHPTSWGQGIGTSLFRAMTDRNHRRLPLQTAVWETSIRAVRFLQRNGCTEARRTYEPHLSLATVSSTADRSFEQTCLHHGYRIASLADLTSDPDHHRRLAALCAEAYAVTHAINPAGPLTIQEWETILAGEPVATDTSYVAIRDNEYAAFSLTHPHDSPDTLWFGWRGVAPGHRAAERELTLALTLRQLVAARRRGYTKMQIEADTTDPWAMLQLDYLPFSPAPAWVTFRRA